MMKSALLGAVALCAMSGLPVFAAAPPTILMSAKNKVPACVTPDRLTAFVMKRNPGLLAKFKPVAKHYKEHGDELGVRWDYAFFQMIVETNWLRYHRPNGKPGDVSTSQNNFAGIGATGGGVPGERFPDVSTGVLAHLGHIRLYSGKPLDNPAAKRTKDVTGIILPWAQAFNRPVTFADLTTRWSPTDKVYARTIEFVAQSFRDGYCSGKDVPETNAAAEPVVTDEAATTEQAAAVEEPPVMIKSRAKPLQAGMAPALKQPTTETAAAIDPNKRMSAGLGAAAPVVTIEPAAGALNEPMTGADAEPSTTAINADTARSDAAVTDESPSGEVPPETEQETATDQTEKQVAVLTPPEPPAVQAAKVPSGCRVFTASFGGARSLLIESVEDGLRRLTALTVHEGKETAQADAFIQLHAPGGQAIGTYGTADEALAKAFEICPEK
jgi:Mannosyl-glycoprotein endo-beta-N-acetylglucosaminidase